MNPSLMCILTQTAQRKKYKKLYVKLRRVIRGGEHLNFLDLFAGIGGFRLGMEQAGHKCIGFVEIDKFARQSYKAIHDTEGEWERHDITKVTDNDLRQLRRERGTIHCICGGFPCQTFSIAGKRAGFSDTR